MRPAMADSVVTLTAMAAPVVPRNVDKCASKWESTPTWANRANANAAVTLISIVIVTTQTDTSAELRKKVRKSFLLNSAT